MFLGNATHARSPDPRRARGRLSKKVPTRILASAIEPLEQRVHLSITPTISGSASVAAGAPYTLNLAHTGAAPASWTINWGDGAAGTTDTVVYTGQPNYETHNYNFSTTPYIITASASDGAVSYNTPSPVHVTVGQAAPDVMITGSNTAAQNSVYTLSLSAMSSTYNQGTGSVTSWTVLWGDGQSQTFTQSATFNPAWAMVTHTYTATSGVFTITASAANNAGSFSATPIAVTVNPGLPTTFAAAQGQAFDVGDLDGTGSVNVGSGVSVTADQVRESSLTISGLLTIDPGNGLNDASHASVVSSLVLTQNGNGLFVGTLNLTDNTLIIETTSATQQSIYQLVIKALASGRNNGAWNGTGITSSTAATDPTHGLGAIMNKTASGAALYTTFDGQAVDANAIIISYALYGDVNLDGKVNATDPSVISSNYGSSVTGGWAQGDFNYDGFVNATDDALFYANWSKTTSISSATDSSTPPQFVATFLSNASDPSSDFTAAINWGDGSAATAGAFVSDGNGTYHVLATHVYSTPGTYTVQANVTELDNHATWTIQSSASVAAVYAGTGGSVYAPPLPNLQYSAPTSNPTLPAGMNTFSPPGTNVTPPAGAPVFAAADSTASPNGSFSVTGTNFTAPGNPDPNDDTRFLIYGQSGLSNGTLTDAQIQDISAYGATLTVSSSEPSNSMYIVWAINNAAANGQEAASIPIAINDTSAQWVGTDGQMPPSAAPAQTISASPGQTLSIYGQNLSNGAASPQSWVYLQPTTGQGTWAKVTAVNPYKVDFVIPGTLTAGATYQIWINNGLGGKYSWSLAPTTLTVGPAAQPWSTAASSIINVTSYGAIGDGKTNDLSAIQNAINALQPGDTLYFPTGTYLVNYGATDSPLNLPQTVSNIRIMGDSPSASVIKFGGIVPTTGDPWEFGEVQQSQRNGTMVGPGNIEFDSMTFEYNGTSFGTAKGGSLLSFELRSNLTFNHVTLISGPLTSIDLMASTQVTIENSTIVGGTIYGLGGTNFFVNNDNFFMQYNSEAALFAVGSHNISLTNSTVQDYDNSSDDPSGFGQGRLIYVAPAQATFNQYVAGNTTIALQNNVNDVNAGEQILSEGPTHGDTYYGAVASATSNSITFNTATLPSNFFSGLSVIVTQGTGLAQMETESGAPTYTFNLTTGLYAMTLTLNGKWNEIPNTTSTIEVVADTYNSVFYMNTLQDAAPNGQTTLGSSAGFQLYDGGYNDVFDSNTVVNAKTGVYLDSNDFHNPDDFIQVINNHIVNSWGYGVIISPDMPSLSSGLPDTDPNDVGVVVRNNTITGPPVGITLQERSASQSMFTIIEDNTISAPATGNSGSNAAVIVSNDPNVLIDQNTIVGPTNATPAPAVSFLKTGSSEVVLRDNIYSNYQTTPIYSGVNGLPLSSIASPVDVLFATASPGGITLVTIPLLDDGPTPLTWTVSNPGTSWIMTPMSSAMIATEDTPSAASGASENLTINAAGLSSGLYFSSIQVTADGITKFLGVWLTVQ